MGASASTNRVKGTAASQVARTAAAAQKPPPQLAPRAQAGNPLTPRPPKTLSPAASTAKSLGDISTTFPAPNSSTAVVKSRNGLAVQPPDGANKPTTNAIVARAVAEASMKEETEKTREADMKKVSEAVEVRKKEQREQEQRAKEKEERREENARMAKEAAERREKHKQDWKDAQERRENEAVERKEKERQDEARKAKEASDKKRADEQKKREKERQDEATKKAKEIKEKIEEAQRREKVRMEEQERREKEEAARKEEEFQEMIGELAVVSSGDSWKTVSNRTLFVKYIDRLDRPDLLFPKRTVHIPVNQFPDEGNKDPLPFLNHGNFTKSVTRYVLDTEVLYGDGTPSDKVCCIYTDASHKIVSPNEVYSAWGFDTGNEVISGPVSIAPQMNTSLMAESVAIYRALDWLYRSGERWSVVVIGTDCQSFIGTLLQRSTQMSKAMVPRFADEVIELVYKMKERNGLKSLVMWKVPRKEVERCDDATEWERLKLEFRNRKE